MYGRMADTQQQQQLLRRVCCGWCVCGRPRAVYATGGLEGLLAPSRNSSQGMVAGRKGGLCLQLDAVFCFWVGCRGWWNAGASCK